MTLHVQISGQGFSLRASARYNLSADEVQSQFVQPWAAGTEIVVGGRVFEPRNSEISVREGPELSFEELQGLTAWLLVTERCTDVTDDFITVAPGVGAAERGSSPDDSRLVGVVHGRDGAAKAAVEATLRGLDLRPLEWTELVKATGSAAPSTKSVVERIFAVAQAVVVLFSPDEEARLHPDLVPDPDLRGEGAPVVQARPNVLLEAGMAIATHPERTIFVEIGNSRLPSDLDGVNTVRLDGTVPPLHDLALRLESAGCEVNRNGTAWLETSGYASLKARLRIPNSPSAS